MLLINAVKMYKYVFIVFQLLVVHVVRSEIKRQCLTVYCEKLYQHKVGSTMDVRQLMNRAVKMEIENVETSCNSNSYRKKKRFRSAFTTDQINGLEKEYKRFPYIDVVNRKVIAKSLNIPEKAVKIWFQNRRMKEKRDKTHNNYEESHNAVNLVNDQSADSIALQSNTEPVPNSFSPQMNSRTGLRKEVYEHLPKCQFKSLNNISTEKTDKEDKKRSDDIMTNNVVTSSTNDRNSAKSSNGHLKNYKNDLHKTVERPRQKIVPKPRLEVTDKFKYSPHPNISQVAHASSSMPQRTIPQIPVGYVSPHAQNAQSCYQQPCLPVGNVLWKSMQPNMASVMPMNQMALIPHPTAQNLNIQERKCSCNCHGNSQQNLAYPQENQLPPPQYVFAVPFHNTPSHYTYPF